MKDEHLPKSNRAPPSDHLYSWICNFCMQLTHVIMYDKNKAHTTNMFNIEQPYHEK
jgi:hypothetical protein